MRTCVRDRPPRPDHHCRPDGGRIQGAVRSMWGTVLDPVGVGRLLPEETEHRLDLSLVAKLVREDVRQDLLDREIHLGAVQLLPAAQFLKPAGNERREDPLRGGGDFLAARPRQGRRGVALRDLRLFERGPGPALDVGRDPRILHLDDVRHQVSERLPREGEFPRPLFRRQLLACVEQPAASGPRRRKIIVQVHATPRWASGRRFPQGGPRTYIFQQRCDPNANTPNTPDGPKSPKSPGTWSPASGAPASGPTAPRWPGPSGPPTVTRSTGGGPSPVSATPTRGS